MHSYSLPIVYPKSNAPVSLVRGFSATVPHFHEGAEGCSPVVARWHVEGFWEAQFIATVGFVPAPDADERKVIACRSATLLEQGRNAKFEFSDEQFRELAVIGEVLMPKLEAVFFDLPDILLHPCPFCGEWGYENRANEIKENNEGTQEVYWIACDFCEARSGNNVTRQAAHRAWNARTSGAAQLLSVPYWMLNV